MKIINNDEESIGYSLRNLETEDDITTIDYGEEYTLHASQVGETDYEFRQGGFSWHTFTLDVKPQTGYVNNPEYDAKISLDVNIMFNPTNLSVYFPNKKYNLNFYETDEGLFSITNEGDEKARNVTLRGDWMEFDKNHFNLDVGRTKTISYTITPFKGKGKVETNDTNKTYNKDITISGNFPTMKREQEIFVEYSNIGDDVSNVSSRSGLIAFIEQFCKGNPDVVDAPLIAAAAREGDQEAIHIFRLTGQLLGVGIANVVNLFDPEIIVLGGGVMHAQDLFMEELKASLKERALKPNLKDLQLKEAKLGKDTGVKGAIAVAMCDYLYKNQ